MILHYNIIQENIEKFFMVKQICEAHDWVRILHWRISQFNYGFESNKFHDMRVELKPAVQYKRLRSSVPEYMMNIWQYAVFFFLYIWSLNYF